jgi:hypothetical protein
MNHEGQRKGLYPGETSVADGNSLQLMCIEVPVHLMRKY